MIDLMEMAPFLTVASALIMTGVFLAAVVIRMIRAARPRRADGSHLGTGAMMRFLRTSGWIVAFLALLVFMSMLAGPVGFALWLAAVVTAVIAAIQVKEAERRALVWSLTVASEKGFPLSDAARAFADERYDALGDRARALAQWLERGMHLDFAMEQAGIRLPNDSLLAVRMGSKVGSLKASLRSAAHVAADLARLVQSSIGKVVYLIFFVFLMSGILTFLMLKIAPEYVKIFTDFKTALPASSVLLMASSEFVARNTALILTISLLLFFILLFALARYAGLVRWDPPMMRRFARPLDQAAIVRSLAQAVEQERPLPVTISALSECYPKSHVQQQLQGASRQLERGANWLDALTSQGLLKPTDAGVLHAAQRLGNLSWALHDTADRLVRRFVARITALLAIGFPLMLLGIAVLVGLIAVGMFQPLAELIYSLTPPV